MPHRTNTGFTLVEISIILVIIGLIVGGVITGQDLIRQSRLQKLIHHIEEYRIATYAFNDKFDYFPGDIPNAWDYWGTKCVPGTGSAVWCNGDGDGDINYNLTSPVYRHEALTFWNHLQLAEMIAGQYSGRQTGSPQWANIGVNIPGSPLKGGGFDVGRNDIVFGRSGNYFGFGSISPGDGQIRGAALSPANAWFIDQKTDDGSADSGHLRATYIITNAVNHDCTGGVASQSALQGSYDLDNQEIVCRIVAFF